MTTPLTPFSICTSQHNPHELLVLKCSSCRAHESQSRLEFQKAGWVLMKDPLYESHEGFPVCSQCATSSFDWEDLY